MSPLIHQDGTSLWLYCPACRGQLRITTPPWTWNGDTEKPSIGGSILTRGRNSAGETLCHAFINDGVWEFLADCTHHLAGQRIPMVPLPSYFFPADKETTGA